MNPPPVIPRPSGAVARIVPAFATGLVFTAFLVSLWLVQRIFSSGPLEAVTVWFSGPETNILAGIRVDSLSAVMLSMVLGIATLVFGYSMAYMRGEPLRYWLFLGMFVAAMALLLIASSTLVLFGTWELVGFCSYLLIGFWRDQEKPARASQKAFIINRVGDAMFLTGLLLLAADRKEEWVFVLLFLGVCAKSAQFPLHGWLPDAMAGPTPVSSLIHAATMVAAGVYVFARFAHMMPPSVMVLAAAIGSISAVYGACMALLQTDLKRMLAYSTMSQLGLMMLGIASGDTSAGLMHLFAHAFFKCALFLLAGILIHLAHTQQLTQIGRFRQHASPQTVNGLMLLFAVAAAALAGVPLTSGFLTKDAVIAASLGYGAKISWIFPAAAVLTTLLTGIYLSRAFRWIFVADLPGNLPEHPQEKVSLLQWIPVLLLALGSGWWILSWNPLDATGGWLGVLMQARHAETHEWAMMLSLMAALSGLTAGWFGWRVQAGAPVRAWMRAQQQRFRFRPKRGLAMAAAFEDAAISDVEPGRLLLAIARAVSWADKKLLDGAIMLVTNAVVHAHPHWPSLAKTAATFDAGIVDGLVNGVAWGIGRMGKTARSLQGGKVQTYLIFAGLALLSAIVWMMLGEG